MAPNPNVGWVSADEKRPLLGRIRRQTSRLDSLSMSLGGVQLQKNIGLVYAVGLVLASVAGSGIFISPTGVLQQVGSVGASLIIWVSMGLLSLLMALCYAELGSALPIAGGDYAYVNHLLGPLPAFMVLWANSMLNGPCAAAVMARTVAAYFLFSFDRSCYLGLTVAIAILVNLTVAAMNMVSTVWPARLLTALSLAKLLAMAVIIGTGIVKLAQGYTDNLVEPFSGTVTNPGHLVYGALSGYVTYGGWSSLNSLAEEMKNPKRDLVLTSVISLLLITAIYVLMNLSYFTMLSPQEFITSEAVAASWAERALPGAAWLIQLAVIMSALGSSLGLFLAQPRIVFSGGRNGSYPGILGCLHITYTTPVAATILFCLVSCMYASVVFYDLQTLLQLVGSMSQLRQSLALIALIKLKTRHSNLSRSIKIPLVVVIFLLLCLIGMVGVAIYQAPEVSGVGLIIFLLGIPLYFLSLLPAKSKTFSRHMDSVTRVLQQLLMVVPASKN